MEPVMKKKKVKAVTWVDDTKLCSFFYFQLDENERGIFDCFGIFAVIHFLAFKKHYNFVNKCNLIKY